MCMWCVFPKRERQTSRHGPGLILMQPHGVGLRLRDNCCSEEWMAWELSSHTGASHQAVHHMGLTSDILRRETKAISSVCAQLMHKHTKLTSHNLVAYKVRHRHVYRQHYPCVSLPFPSHYHPPSPPPYPVLSNLTSHLLSLTYMFPPREETEA